MKNIAAKPGLSISTSLACGYSLQTTADLVRRRYRRPFAFVPAGLLDSNDLVYRQPFMVSTSINAPAAAHTADVLSASLPYRRQHTKPRVLKVE